MPVFLRVFLPARGQNLIMKYSNYIGIAAALILIIACFLPWAYYPEIDKTFTGFYSEQNHYGKPGKTFIFFAVLAIFLFIMPRIWAKRFNLVVAVLTVAYSIKTYYLYASCYRGICPDKKFGLFVVMGAALILLLAALLPDMKQSEKKL